MNSGSNTVRIRSMREMMPTSFPRSVTGTRRIWWSCNTFITSGIGVSRSTLITFLVMMSSAARVSSCFPSVSALRMSASVITPITVPSRSATGMPLKPLATSCIAMSRTDARGVAATTGRRMSLAAFISAHLLRIFTSQPNGGSNGCTSSAHLIPCRAQAPGGPDANYPGNVPQQEIELILMRHLAAYLALPIFLVGPDGRLLFYNEPAERLLGRPFDASRDMPKEEWLAAFAPSDHHGTRLPPEQIPLLVALEQRGPGHTS